MPWTALGRANGRILATLGSIVIPLLIPCDRTSTVACSGAYLAALTSDAAYADCHGNYFSVRGQKLQNVPPSELARDDTACAKLWEQSAKFVGLEG